MIRRETSFLRLVDPSTPVALTVVGEFGHVGWGTSGTNAPPRPCILSRPPESSRAQLSVLPIVREAAVTLLIAAVVLATVFFLGIIVTAIPVILPFAFLVCLWRVVGRKPGAPVPLIRSEDVGVPWPTPDRPPRLQVIVGGKGTDARGSAPRTHHGRPRAG